MKRALPILGVAGLALLSITAPAYATDNYGDTDENLGKVIVCHATGSATNPYVATPVNLNALKNLGLESGDIVPPNPVLKDGHNWATGLANYYKYCAGTPPVEEEPPGEEHPPGEEEPPGEEHPPGEEEPPGEEHPPGEEQPPVEEEGPPAAEQPPAVIETPATLPPAAQVPAGQAAAPQGAVAKVPAAAVSRGTNQGYNAQTSVGGAGDSTTWVAGLGLLLGAGAMVAVRRRSRQESPTAG